MQSGETAARERGILGSESITRGFLFAVALFSFFSIALMQISLALAILNWVAGLLRSGVREVRTPLVRPMAGYVIVSVISGALAMTALSVKDAFSDGLTMLGFLVTLNVMTRAVDVRRMTSFIVVGGVLAALYGLAPLILEDSDARLQGSLSHYYTFSGVVMLAVVVGTARVVFAVGLRERALLGVATTCMLIALLFTQTRSAWLAILLGGLVVLVARERRLLAALPVVALLAYFLVPANVQGRIRSMVDLEDHTVSQRVDMWQTGWKMFQDAPIFGIGPRKVLQVYDDYHDPDSPHADRPTPGHLHNNVVNIAVERGVVGLLAWLVFWLAWFARTIGVYRRLDPQSPEDGALRSAVVGALAAGLAFQVMGLFEYNAGDSEVATLGMLVMGLPLAVEGILGAARRAEEGRASSSAG